MKAPISPGQWSVLEETPSTQDVVADSLRSGVGSLAVLSQHQTAGRGRFDRVWVSPQGEALTFSMAFTEYPNHPRPWVIGMSVAVAVAAAIHAKVQWPNDLVLDGKKVGGVLSEVIKGADGNQVVVVGVGVNLNQTKFPEDLAERATSLKLHRDSDYDALRLADQILERINLLPEPHSWASLSPVWMVFDATPGKKYMLANGDEAIALGIGPEGELICSVDGETTNVLAADAMFGV